MNEKIVFRIYQQVFTGEFHTQAVDQNKIANEPVQNSMHLSAITPKRSDNQTGIITCLTDKI